MGTHTFYGVVTSTAAGIFGAEFLDALGIWTNQPGWAPFVVGAIALAGVWALAASNIRRGTRVLLIIEGTTVALILIVSVIVLIRLATGTAPNGNTLDFSVFSVPGGTGLSAVFLWVVFGFLSFAGFEAAATLGEEAREPRRDIPRAILGVAIFGGLYFIFVTAIEVMGFGTDAKGVKEFIASGSLLGDLGSLFVAGWVGELITIGAAVSAFGCALACVVGAARLLYALSRDEAGPAPLATIGAAKLLFLSGERRVAAWEVVVPLLALIVIGYTLLRNVYPYPTDAAAWYPSSPRSGSSRGSSSR